jgi:hypothetical protein
VLRRVLRRLLGPKRNEVTGGWRQLHNEKLHDLYSLRNIITMIKSMRMGWGTCSMSGEEESE